MLNFLKLPETPHATHHTPWGDSEGGDFHAYTPSNNTKTRHERRIIGRKGEGECGVMLNFIKLSDAPRHALHALGRISTPHHEYAPSKNTQKCRNKRIGRMGGGGGGGAKGERCDCKLYQTFGSATHHT